MSNVINVEEDEVTLSRKRFEIALTGWKPEWSKARICAIIRLIEEFQAASELKKQLDSSHYYYAKHYEIVEEDGQKCLAHKRNKIDDQLVKIVPVEEYYDVLGEVHCNTQHGGREKMLTAMRDKYFIPAPVVRAFVRTCQICQKRRAIKASMQKVVFVTNRGEVKLIDMQSFPDERYEWILHYQDSNTKFSFLRPLTSNEPAVIASELLKIFLEIGHPTILVTENGREFTDDIIKELADLWPICIILNGTPGPESPDPTAEVIENVYLQLTEWMTENSSSNWAKGVYFVQFNMNCTYDPRVQNTPYEALFGCGPKKLYRPCKEDLDSTLKKRSVTAVYVRKFKNPSIESSSSSVQKVKYADPLSKVCEEVIVPKSDHVLKKGSVSAVCVRKFKNPSIESSSSSVQKVKYADPISKVCEEVIVPKSNHALKKRSVSAVCVRNFENPSIESSSSSVQKVKYADPLSNVYEEVIVHKSDNGISALLPEHEVQIKTEYDNAIENEPMQIKTELDIKKDVEDTTADEPMIECLLSSECAVLVRARSTEMPIPCAVCWSKTVPTHSCDSCHRNIHESCGIPPHWTLNNPLVFCGLLCPSCHEESKKNIDDEVVLVENAENEPEPVIKLERNPDSNLVEELQPEVKKIKLELDYK